MEDDIDIYEDLPSFEAKLNENSIKNKKKDISSEQTELKKQIAELIVKLEHFQKVNKNLECNLHSLLKTAKAEIARKDKMINDLRKKLDDITFKRRIYPKFNKNVAHSSTTQNTVKNNHYKPIGPDFSPLETKVEALVTDLQCNQIKEQQSKSTLTPITVYGERLRKRIIDEQNLEKKEKLNSNDNNNINSDKEGTEKYIGESDKENGSFTGTNLCNTKNTQPSIAVQLIEQECTKSPVTMLKITEKESIMEDKHITDRIPGTSVKCTGKRTLEEADEHVPVKQIKFDEDTRLTKSMKKENNVHDVLDRIHDVSKYTTTESSSNISEKRNAPKSSDTGYAYDLSTKIKKYESFISNDWNKKEEKKVAKRDSNTTCDNRIINACSSKRQNKSAANITFRSDECKTGDCSLETFKRESHRSVGEHRRIRQKESRYSPNIVDHRSFRVRETISYTKSPEEKYSRDQYPKHVNYGDRFEKHYDYRGHSADKSRAVNKELCGIRDLKKRMNVSRNSTDRKTNNSKKSNHYEGYEGRRLRSADRKAKLEREKQTEYCEIPKDHVEKFRNGLKEHEILKRNDRKENYSVIVQIERIDEKNKELEKRTKKSEKPVTNLEKGELANSPEKGDKRKKLENKGIEELSELSSSIDKDVKNKLAKEPRISMVDNISECPLMEQDNKIESESNPRSLKVNESVENVENIEKFIRELASNNSNPEKKHETLSVIACSNLNEKVSIIGEGVDEELKTKEKERPSGSENTCCNIPEGEQFFENVGGLETRPKQSKNEKISLNEVILNSVDNPLLNKTTDVAENQSKIDGQFETIAKEDLLLVLGSESPCVSSTSLLESANKADSNYIETTIKADDDKNDIPSNHRPDDRNGNKEQKMKQNDLTADENKEKEHLNATTVTRTEQSKRATKAREEEKKRGSKELKKLPIRRDDAKAKRASLNVQGKIVVFVNRRKPVSLADSNANMTVLVNHKKHDASYRITTDDITPQCKPPLKKIRISDSKARNIN